MIQKLNSREQAYVLRGKILSCYYLGPKGNIAANGICEMSSMVNGLPEAMGEQ